MNDEHWRSSLTHVAFAEKTRRRAASWELLMALKASAIILSVVAAIVIFHG